MSSLDLAIFLPTLSAGGASRIVLNVGEYLQDEGYDVEMVLAREEGEFLDHVEDLEVTGFGSSVLGSLLPLRRYLRRRQPDALLSTTVPANVVAIWAHRLARVDTRHVVREPSIMSMEYDSPRGLRERALPRLVRLSYPRAQRFVAISEGVKTALVEDVGVEGDRVEVVYNPIVTPGIREKAEDEVYHPWFQDDVPIVLGAGRLTEQKDFRTLIGAFAEVRDERECRLVILGEGHLRDELTALAEELGVEDDFDLPGYDDNPYKYMMRCDVFVLSSRWEGFGNVLVEAMACGAPVVATDCPSGPSEILEDGVHGELVPVGDHHAMAAAVIRELDCPREKEKVQERARDFEAKLILPKYEDVLFGHR